MDNDKTLGFLLDCPSKGKVMMFPDFVENLTKELSQYEEVDIRVEDMPGMWSADIAKQNYKTFKRKATKTKD